MEEYDLSADLAGLDQSTSEIEKSVAELLAREGNLHELALREGRGLVFWVLRDPAHPDGFRMIPRVHEELSDAARGFGASPSRPGDYPADVPFLENSAVIVNPLGTSVRVHWIDVENPLQGLKDVIDESRKAGWISREDQPIDLATRATRYVEMNRGNRVRIVSLRIFGNAGGELGLSESDA